MPTIIKIGYQTFLMRKPEAATAVIKAMSDAILVEQKHINRRAVYWPSDDQYQAEVSMVTVRPDCVLAAEPPEAEVETEVTRCRQIGDRQ